MEPIYGLALVFLLLIMPIIMSYFAKATHAHEEYIKDHNCNLIDADTIYDYLNSISKRAQARAK